MSMKENIVLIEVTAEAMILEMTGGISGRRVEEDIHPAGSTILTVELESGLHIHDETQWHPNL